MNLFLHTQAALQNDMQRVKAASSAAPLEPGRTHQTHLSLTVEFLPSSSGSTVESAQWYGLYVSSW